MTASSFRRASSSASLLRHPLRLWQRHTLPGSLRRDALLRLANLAAHRAVAAEIPGTASSPRHGPDGAEQAEGWRRAASGILLGDATALLTLSRGILADRRDGRLEDGVDASLCALQLAMHGGSRSERIVAAAELLLTLPELIGQRDSSRTRRARALSIQFQALQTMILSMPRRTPASEILAKVLGAWAEVAAAGLRTGLPGHLFDDEPLRTAYAALLETVQYCTAELNAGQPQRRASSAGRGRLIGIYPEDEAAGEPDQTALNFSNYATLVPFPGFDADRFADSRSALAKRYARLGTALPLAPTPNKIHAEAALGSLASAMPNFVPVLEQVAGHLALARRMPGRPTLRLPPLLLTGPPGIGKTRFATRLAAALGLQFGSLSLAGSSDSRELAGTARGWSSAHPSWPVEQLVQLVSANPLLLLDEVDKAGGSTFNGRAHDTVLALLEPGTSSRYQDDCVGGPIDLSQISWVLTANDASVLPAPLRSRVVIVQIRPPGLDQVGSLIDGILADLAADHGLADARMLPTIPAMLLDELRAAYARRRDPRRLRAGLQRALAMSAQLEEGACTDLAPVLH